MSSCTTNQEQPIKYSEFKNTVEIQLPTLIENKSMDSIEAVRKVKIYNTIYYYSLTDSIFVKYANNFDRFCLYRIVKRFNCQLSIGMGFYCPGQNIYIGGSSRFVEGSYYKLDSLTLPASHLVIHR